MVGFTDSIRIEEEEEVSLSSRSASAWTIWRRASLFNFVQRFQANESASLNKFQVNVSLITA